MVNTRTKEITEAAVFYIHDLKMDKYLDKYWYFEDKDSKASYLRKKIINKEIRVEPLEFMDAIRRVKAFANS